MKQILGINEPHSNPKESLTGCNSSESLPDNSYIPLDFETNESTVAAIADRLSDDREPTGEDLAAIGQEVDSSPEVDRFVTHLLPEKEILEESLNPRLFHL
ncbi:MAG: hypothetical protein WBD58_04880 [Geitlerinemataceae cyanobacterium]